MGGHGGLNAAEQAIEAKFESLEFEKHSFSNATLASRQKGDDSATRNMNATSTAKVQDDEDDEQSAYVKARSEALRETISKWSATLFAGIITGVVCSVVHLVVGIIASARLDLVNEAMHSEAGNPWGLFLAILFTTGLTAVASFGWFFDKSIGGSGLPEVIAYLNGVDLTHMFKVSSTILCMIGTTAVCASGLAVGYEGPLIRIGAAVAYNVVKLFPMLRERGSITRDMTAIGAGMGLTAAFKAPLAGTIFVFEELCTAPLTADTVLRTFAGCIGAYFTVYWLNTAPERVETEFGARMTTNCPSQLWWLPINVVIGVAGGIIGALFNFINLKVVAFRKRLTSPVARSVETLILCVVTACAFTLLPVMFSCDGIKTPSALMEPKQLDKIFQSREIECVTDATSSQLINTITMVRNPDGSMHRHYVYNQNAAFTQLDMESLSTAGCNRSERVANHYNPVASLVMVQAVDAGRTLMSEHLPRIFEARHLIAALVVYFLLASISAGGMYPSGLVLPHIFIGSLIGRLVAVCVNIHGLDHSIMAISGAASMLAGSGRIVLFLTVVMIEITGDIQYAPPIALTSMVALVVGNMFNHGLYHELIHFKHIPLLDESPAGSLSLTCGEIMSKGPLVTLRRNMRIAHAMLAIENSKHNVFPVTSPTGNLVGRVSREDIVSRSEGVQENLLINEIMDPAPFALCYTQRAFCAYTSFVAIGLRQIVVTDETNTVVGVISRKDLLPWRLEKAMHDAAHGDTHHDEHEHGFSTETEAGRTNGLPLTGGDGGKGENGVTNGQVNPLFESTDGEGQDDLDAPLPSVFSTACPKSYLYVYRILRCARRRQPEPNIITKRTCTYYNWLESLQLVEESIPAAAALITIFESPDDSLGLGFGSAVHYILVITETSVLSVYLFCGLLRQQIFSDSTYWMSTRVLCCSVLVADGIFSVCALWSGAPWAVEYNVKRPARFLEAFLLIESTRHTRHIATAIRASLKPISCVLVIVGCFLLLYSFVLYVMLRGVRPDLESHDFSTMGRSLKNVIILLTTANYPDVMLPFYDYNSFYAILFLAFLIVSVIFLLNMFIAITLEVFQTFGKAHGVKLERRQTRQFLRAFSILSVKNKHDDSGMWVAREDYVRSEKEASMYGLSMTKDLQAKQAETLFRIVDEECTGQIGPEAFLHLCELQCFVILKKKQKASKRCQKALGLQTWDDGDDEKSREGGDTITSSLANAYESLRESCLLLALRPEFEASILFVLLADLILCIAEQASCTATQRLEGASEARIVLSCLYVVEVIIRYLAFGWKDIFGNMLKSIETIIIIACLPLTITWQSESQALIMLRIVRFIYVFNYISVFKPILVWLQRIQKAMINAGSHLIVGVSALFMFMVLGVICFYDALQIYPDAADVTRYCQPTMVAPATNVTAPVWRMASGCLNQEKLLHTPCYKAVTPTVPCDVLNPKVAGSIFSVDKYYHNNFSTNPSAIVTLLHLLFVNNWHVTMTGFMRATTPAAALFFYAFYFVVVVFVLNMFIAFVLTSFLRDFGEDEDRPYSKAIVTHARQRLTDMKKKGEIDTDYRVTENEQLTWIVFKDYLSVKSRMDARQEELDIWYKKDNQARTGAYYGAVQSTNVNSPPPPPPPPPAAKGYDATVGKVTASELFEGDMGNADAAGNLEVIERTPSVAMADDLPALFPDSTVPQRESEQDTSETDTMPTPSETVAQGNQQQQQQHQELALIQQNGRDMSETQPGGLDL